MFYRRPLLSNALMHGHTWGHIPSPLERLLASIALSPIRSSFWPKWAKIRANGSISLQAFFQRRSNFLRKSLSHSLLVLVKISEANKLQWWWPGDLLEYQQADLSRCGLRPRAADGSRRAQLFRYF